MELTGKPLLAIVVILAAAAPIALLVWWHRSSGATLQVSALRLLALLTAEGLALSAMFLWVNNQYGFYSSWSDLLGRTGGSTPISTSGLRPGAGRIELLDIPGGPGTNGGHQVLVWLPPQYLGADGAPRRFPVLMVLPGQPSTPTVMFKQYDFGTIASNEIERGRVQPFIAVFPPLMTDPPRDTECTDIPGGPQADSWLFRNVYEGIRSRLRTDGKLWSVLGWSTGGFCAAKLLLTHPKQYRAGVAFGGYFWPIIDHTTGNLFRSEVSVEDLNSPVWLYTHRGLSRRLLVVTGRQDGDSYADTRRFLLLARGDPAVSSVIFSAGGHNYHNYRAYLPTALEWLRM